MDKFLSILGMCRKAGMLSCGHDAAVESIVKNRAKLCMVSADGSERLKSEMSHACSFEGKDIKFMVIGYTVSELSHAAGTKAAVFTADDEGFAKKLASLYGAGGAGEACENKQKG